MTWEIKKNESHGFMEVIPKPSEEELNKYYAEKYYQQDKATYSHHYEKEELDYFSNKINEKWHIIDQYQKSQNLTYSSLCDIGCGEGFTLNHFFQLGWDVHGIDFSAYGLNQQHPALSEFFTEGDIFETINDLVKSEKKFDVIWLDNVLEHVIAPNDLMQKCHQIVTENGILVVEVPNDFSKLQMALKNKEKIQTEYWVAYPDHLSYFSRESLASLGASCGWNCFRTMADHPIEYNLINDHSNYTIDRNKGKQAHKTRMFIDNFLHANNSLEDIVSYYTSLSKLNQGRQIIAFFEKESE